MISHKWRQTLNSIRGQGPHRARDLNLIQEPLGPHLLPSILFSRRLLARDRGEPERDLRYIPLVSMITSK